MALLELGGRKFTIPVGEVVLGADAGCAIQLAGAGIEPRHAIVHGMADGQVVIRKAVPRAEVLINGVRLGAEPTPLLHGDKLDVGGHELTFVDERRSGSTMYVQAMNLQQAAAETQAEAAKKAAAPSAQPATVNGRVVCLTDGREYRITGNSLVFGREAGCDVVVPGKDVSRRHAEILPTPKGYLLVDSSTNGTFVNDERIQGQRILNRGEVIRIGEESFRFYADVAAAPPAPPAPPPAPAPAPPQPGPAASQPPAAPQASPPRAGAGERLKDTAFGVPAAAAAGGAVPAGPLATFLVKSGALKGQRVPVRTPVVNIGRADYNDLVLPDASVSTAHAKLQRREGVWVLLDLDSTNGTFVDGERVRGEAPIVPGAMVRFGEVQLVFDPTDDALGVAKGGGTKLMGVIKTPASQPPAPRPAPDRAGPRPAARPARKRPAAAAAPQPEKKKKGCGSSAAALLLGLAALAYWILA